MEVPKLSSFPNWLSTKKTREIAGAAATAADTAMMPIEAGKLAGQLHEITRPVLVMSGDGDKIVSFEHQSRRLAAELLGGQIEVIPGAGHMLHHTAPERVAGAIEGFLHEIGFSPPAEALAAVSPELAEAPVA